MKGRKFEMRLCDAGRGDLVWLAPGSHDGFSAMCLGAGIDDPSSDVVSAQEKPTQREIPETTGEIGITC